MKMGGFQYLDAVPIFNDHQVFRNGGFRRRHPPGP